MSRSNGTTARSSFPVWKTGVFVLCISSCVNGTKNAKACVQDEETLVNVVNSAVSSASVMSGSLEEDTADGSRTVSSATNDAGDARRAPGRLTGTRSSASQFPEDDMRDHSNG